MNHVQIIVANFLTFVAHNDFKHMKTLFEKPVLNDSQMKQKPNI